MIIFALRSYSHFRHNRQFCLGGQSERGHGQSLNLIKRGERRGREGGMGRNAIATPNTGRRVLARFWPPRFAAAHWTRAKTQERENGAPSAIKSVKSNSNFWANQNAASAFFGKASHVTWVHLKRRGMKSWTISVYPASYSDRLLYNLGSRYDMQVKQNSSKTSLPVSATVLLSALPLMQGIA